MTDYKFIVGNEDDCEKQLNEMQKDYRVEVLKMTIHISCLYILIKRVKKEQPW